MIHRSDQLDPNSKFTDFFRIKFRIEFKHKFSKFSNYHSNMIAFESKTDD